MTRPANGAETESSVADRLSAVRERIARACSRSGRLVEEVTLIGASKRQGDDRLAAAAAAGLVDFGENRVAECEAKKPRLAESIRWHLIGPLQSNKARRAVLLFDLVHTVDRAKIARVLNAECERIERSLDVLLEVNLAEEPQKHGYKPADVFAGWRQVQELAALEPVGLMAIPPLTEHAEGAREWFRRLAQLRDEIAQRHGESPGWLSMGMSNDFEIAIEEGATHVRVGTALFGERPPLPGPGV